MLTIAALALALTPIGDPFGRARADIAVWCAGKAASCQGEQRRAMGNFVMIMAGYNDPGNAAARSCMVRGKQGRHVDWTIAVACMRARARGKALGSTL